MNPEIKALWVAKLRDPEVKQGMSTLKRNDCYCCLGVLTELYRTSDENLGKIDWSEDNGSNWFDTSQAFLPTLVADWSGIDHMDQAPLKVPPSFLLKYPKVGLSADPNLMMLNDNGVSFADIADLIETQL